VPELGTVFFLRYGDVMEALLDRRFGAIGVRYYEQQGWCEGPYIDWVRRTVVFLDPPDHDRLRALLSHAFTPRQVRARAPDHRGSSRPSSSTRARARAVDLYDAFAQRLPLQVICGLLAIPSIDHHAVGEWTPRSRSPPRTPRPEARLGADAAILAFDDYVSRSSPSAARSRATTCSRS
jgi:cytochrome P450